jgi:uncharacterized protein YllA (UPF0747 family)
MFEAYGVPFPVLIPRHFGLVFPKHLQKIWEKHELDDADLFHAMPQLEKKWLLQHQELHFSFKEPVRELSIVYQKMQRQAFSIDPSLEAHLKALEKKAKNRIEQAEKKLVRAGKRKHDESLQQIRKVKQNLFPEGQLQERKLNFLHFYLDNPHFIDELLDAFAAFNFQMHILRL